MEQRGAKQILESYAFLVSSAIYVLYFSILLVSALLFGVGVPISRINCVIAVLATIVYCACAVRCYHDEHRLRHFAAIVSTLALIVCASVFVAGRFYDISFDGMCYHQEGIIYLSEGWNPFRSDISQQHFPHLGHMAIVLNSYAKAPWIFASAVYKVTGNIEHGKAINLLLIIASGLLSFSALRTIKELDIVRSMLVSVVCALCPIAVVQFLGYYVDGQLSALLVSFLAIACIVYNRPDRCALFLLIVVMSIATNVKISGGLYIGFFSAALVIFLLIMGEIILLKKVLITLLIGGAVGVCVVGYNPYVRNTLRHGCPFYPLNEKGSGLMEYKGPRDFGKYGNVMNFLLSNFVASDHTWETSGKVRLKIPFTFSRGELSVFNIPDTTIGGFGPLWGGGIFLAGLILFIAFMLDYRRAIIAAYIIVVILISIVGKPYAWYARYNPHFWGVPVVVIVTAFTLKNRFIQALAYALAAVLLVNIVLIASQYVPFQLAQNRNLRGSLRKIAAMPAPVKAYFSVFRTQRLRFQKAGIRYEEVFRLEDLHCPISLRIDCMDASVCPGEGNQT